MRQFDRANNEILAGYETAPVFSHSENYTEMDNEAEERTMRRMAKVHDFWHMWQASQNLRATQETSRTQNKEMTAAGSISDSEEIVKASWSRCYHGGAAAFELTERSPLPPAFSAKDLLEGRTQILNVCRICRINPHPVERDDDSPPESISDTEDSLKSNGDLDNPNDTEDDCTADVESGIEQANAIEDSECPEQRDVSDAPNVPGLIRPTRKSKRQAEKVFVRVNEIETRRNKGVKKK